CATVVVTPSGLDSW
nr:immunoglobulin heavy chain junction region [Macaca mulatta]MOV53860.1 immunoglobulin heavy chain junction region [Macaca mulatta]MOV54940.1 immunoglobulin heavy chain junction region [Macaca mulatta]MOV55019.1 immunoglobulin heavy chain junction region [Macaca mulatta]MOV56122.1 immunoglobulin heavy chain junction region [Macaca mulatta]